MNVDHGGANCILSTVVQVFALTLKGSNREKPGKTEVLTRMDGGLGSSVGRARDSW